MESAAKELGYIDRPTNATDMIFVGLGILLGGIIGALAIHIGGVPISLSTSEELDSRISIWLVAQQTPYLRTNTGILFMGAE